MVREEQNRRFTFALGGIPIRFYHGDSDDAPTKYAEITDGEIRQYRLALDTELQIAEVLRIAIETEPSGRPTVSERSG